MSLADLSASPVPQVVAGPRADRALPPLDPDKAAFTRAEVAAALGVNGRLGDSLKMIRWQLT